jgi:hypothetical protein
VVFHENLNGFEVGKRVVNLVRDYPLSCWRYGRLEPFNARI